LRTGADRYRIADLAVFWDEEPSEEISSEPPYLVAEIVSRDDRYLDILTKLAEYRQWGVEHVWLVDPWLRKLYVFDGRLCEVDRLEIPEIGLAAEPAEIFD
jgi:Uma2 family endonuclease